MIRLSTWNLRREARDACMKVEGSGVNVEDGDFTSKCLNQEMVKVYPLVECDDSEISEVKDLISKHVKYTDSVRGIEILENWNSFS